MRLKKGFFTAFVLLVQSVFLWAQAPVMSASTKMFILKVNELKPLNSGDSVKIKELQKEYPVFVKGKKLMIGALLHVSSQFNIRKLLKKGIEVNTQAGGIISAMVPVPEIEKLGKLKGIILVDVDRLVKTKP